MRFIPIGVGVAALAMTLQGGCAAQSPAHHAATASGSARPATLLVLPPLDDSLNVAASAAVWASATRPLAEAGFYVLPAVLVDETLRRNGIQTPQDAQAIPQAKLRSVFAADAAVYIEVRKYGTSYALVSSETRVEVVARLVDLRDGATLWSGTGKASTSDTDGFSRADDGLVTTLVSSAIRQIVATASDAPFKLAARASDRLFDTSRPDGLLRGPRAQ